MTPDALSHFLTKLVKHRLLFSTMIWGPPGIGKSSIVAQTAQDHHMEIIDLRLSQLAPTDLRGLPVAENGVSRWYPPEFLPTEGRGILFLDEISSRSSALPYCRDTFGSRNLSI
jgi:MoxR-like ATPase